VKVLVSSVSRRKADGRAGRDSRADGPGGLRTAVSRSALRLQSDRRLVALARAGSGAAFAVIVERYRAPLLAYSVRLVGRDEGEDVLQQTFTNALAALGRDDRAIDVRPWLYRIAHNIAVNDLRRSGRHHEQLDEQFDGVPQPPDVLDQKLRLELLVEGIGRLPERQREAIVALELEGRSYEDIAHGMSATKPVVRQLVHRARTRLRDACGVLLPAPALRWLVVTDLRTAGSERVGDALTGGAAGAGLLKAGTALLATGAIATGAGGLVVKSDDHSGSRHQASARAQPQITVSPARESSSPPLQAAVPASRSHAKRGSPATPAVDGGRSGTNSGTQGTGPVRSKGDRGHGLTRRPHLNDGDGATRQDGSDGSSAGETHTGSHDGSGDASGRGDSHGDGSGDSGAPDGSDQPAGSGSPASPTPPPTEQ
jgi:RNA polymerase sigma factor (sigma-70 family)